MRALSGDVCAKATFQVCIWLIWGILSENEVLKYKIWGGFVLLGVFRVCLPKPLSALFSHLRLATVSRLASLLVQKRYAQKNPTIVDKIYETMSRNQAKLDRTRKLWNLFLCNFWPLVPNFYLRKEDWVLSSASYHFCDIPNIS